MTLAPMISAKALGAMPQFVLEAAGEKPLQRALNASHLPFHFVEERSGYIAENSLAIFVHEAARAAGHQNIGLLWAPFLTVRDYGAWGTYVLAAPTLGMALERAASIMPFHSSVDQAWLEHEGGRCRYCYQFCLRGHAAHPDIGFSVIGVFLSIFRAYLGPSWTPSAVLFDFAKVPYAHQAEDTFQCPVIWNASRLGVEFDPAILDTARVAADQTSVPTTVEDIAIERFGGPPNNLIDQVASLARHQLFREEVSAQATAQSLGIGVRSMQRKLEREGVQFRQIVNKVRMSRAKELLELRQETISSVATALGYETANNFSRAFKKSAGLTPSEYRQRIAN